MNSSVTPTNIICLPHTVHSIQISVSAKNVCVRHVRIHQLIEQRHFNNNNLLFRFVRSCVFKSELVKMGLKDVVDDAVASDVEEVRNDNQNEDSGDSNSTANAAFSNQSEFDER